MLYIRAILDTDQLWVCSALIRLGPMLKNVFLLEMDGIDLDCRHPYFYKACSLFVVDQLTLQNVRYSRTSHLARFVKLMRPENSIHIDSDSDYGATVQYNCIGLRRQIVHPSNYGYSLVLVSLELT